jgi:hypothetical protein
MLPPRPGIAILAAALATPAALATAAGLATTPVLAIERDAYRDIRGRYEGLTLRLRLDLKAATRAPIPNVLSLEGLGHGSERAPILFGRLEKVYIERVTREGGTRLGLTLYRSREEADRLRASDVPSPMMPNPNFGGTLAAFARQGSTSVILDLRSRKQDGRAQLAEIEVLLERLFYRGEPPREELEDYVRAHPGMPISRLQAITGLDPDTIRRLVQEAAPPRAD